MSTTGAAWDLPLFDLRLSAEDRAAVMAVLESGWLTMGPETEAFEQEAAGFLGAPHALMVSSGTAALQLALLALCDSENDAVRRPVIVPSITFAATANVAAMHGHPVLIADIEAPDRPLLCPRETRRLLEQNPNAIVMPVHYAGYSCDLREVLRDFPEADVIEDAAHAFGGLERVGDAGDTAPLGGATALARSSHPRAIAAHSFFSNKNLATGEGGLLVTHDAALAERARRLRSHGMNRMTWERHRRDSDVVASSTKADRTKSTSELTERTPLYEVGEPGLNLRPTEMAAALARSRMARIAPEITRRRELIGEYRRALEPLRVRLAFGAADDAMTSGHIAAALFPSASAAVAAKSALDAARIQTSHHYWPLHRFAAYDGVTSKALPNAEAFAARELTLPLYPAMTDEDVRRVARIIGAARV